MKRILMIVPSPFFADRGCHVRIYEEAKALQKRGHEVKLLTYHLGRDLPDLDVERTLNVPWYTKEEAGPSVHKLYLDLLLLFKAIRTLWTFKPDLIHAHLHEGAAIGLVLKKMFDLPVVFDFQGSLSGELADHGVAKSGWLQKLVVAVERWINRNSDLILTSSNNARQLLVNDWALPIDRVVNVPDGIDPDREIKADPNLRNELGLPSEKKLVTYMGTLNTLEGADLLLDVAEQVVTEAPEAHFLVIGYPNVAHYRAEAWKRGLAESMTFTGRVRHAETFGYLGISQIAVSPKIAITEGNLKLCYYMQAGLPTVVFDNEVNRELLGEVGYYAPHGDADAMAEQVLKLLRRKRRPSAKKIQQQVLEKFSMDRLVQIIEDGYEQSLRPR